MIFKLKNYFGIFILLLLSNCDQKAKNSEEVNSNNTGFNKTSQKDTAEQDNIISRLQLFDLEGNPVDHQELKGKTIFLNFWATWCRPCIKEMPSIERAKAQLGEKGFVFLAASDEDIGKIIKFKDNNNYTFRFLQLKSDMASLGVYSLPTTFLINENGEIVFNKAGALEWDDPVIIEKMINLAHIED